MAEATPIRLKVHMETVHGPDMDIRAARMALWELAGFPASSIEPSIDVLTLALGNFLQRFEVLETRERYEHRPVAGVVTFPGLTAVPISKGGITTMGFPVPDNSAGQKCKVTWKDAEGNPADTTGCTVAWALSDPAKGSIAPDPAGDALSDALFVPAQVAGQLGDVDVAPVLTKPDGSQVSATPGTITVIASAAMMGEVTFPS